MTKQVALRRLSAVLRGWPENPSMKGRDLGEFLASTYKVRIEQDKIPNVRETIRSSQVIILFSSRLARSWTV